MPYVELHARSAFSFLEGASLPETLASACAVQNLPALALLDRNGVYGSPRFHMAARKSGIHAHVGAEISVADAFGTSYYPVLCQSRVGYQNLCRLLTKTKLRAPKNTPTAATMGELEEHAEGLICLTGDEQGPLARALYSGGMAAAREWLTRLKSIFGARGIYVELQRHFQREQERRNRTAIELAREQGLPILATNGVSYATPAEREVLDVFTCIRNNEEA
jgi:error-prone DNA polymerase